MSRDFTQKTEDGCLAEQLNSTKPMVFTAVHESSAYWTLAVPMSSTHLEFSFDYHLYFMLETKDQFLFRQSFSTKAMGWGAGGTQN